MVVAGAGIGKEVRRGGVEQVGRAIDLVAADFVDDRVVGAVGDNDIVEDHVRRRIVRQTDAGDTRLDDGVVDHHIIDALVRAVGLVGEMNTARPGGDAVVI